jgi:hypothetical protein
MFGSSPSTAMLRKNASAKPNFLAKDRHDLVIGSDLEQRVDDLVAPLERPVGRRHRAVGLELGRGRQQVDAVGAVMQHRRHGRERIDDDQQVELLHRLLHFRQTGLRVRARGPRSTMARTLSGCRHVSLSSSTPSIQRETGMPFSFIIGLSLPS